MYSEGKTLCVGFSVRGREGGVLLTVLRECEVTEALLPPRCSDSERRYFNMLALLEALNLWQTQIGYTRTDPHSDPPVVIAGLALYAGLFTLVAIGLVICAFAAGVVVWPIASIFC